MVMELASGGELYQRVRRNGRLAEGEVKRIFAAIVEGVYYLHSHGIIHRDLKLSNILLSSEGMPKIADFGLAVKVAGDRDSEQQTLCGTPNYLAPEVILKNPYGKAADLWSLGCLLYSMIVGRPPFESTDIRDTFSRVSRGDFRIPEDVSPDARDLISRLIVLDPKQRIPLESIRRHPFVRPPPVPLFHQAAANDNSCLSTAHLRPIRQTTRHGVLQILDDGRLLLDFHSEEDLLIISADGTIISAYSRPWDPCQSLLKSQYRHDNLPLGLKSKYDYARRFVALLRSKTPQIIIVSERIKSYLMDNPAPHDLQVRYSDGTKVEYSPSSKQIIIRDPSGGEERISGLYLSFTDRISNPRTRSIVTECMEQYRQCLEIAQKIFARRDQYPFPYTTRLDHSSSDQHVGDSCLAEITAPQMSALISTSMASLPSTSRALSDAERSFEYAYKTYLPNVGWCLASAAEQFLLLFADGNTVLIDGRRNRVAFHDCHGPTRWLSIDQHLPPMLKQKLAYFPKFVQLLKSGQGHSFVS